MCRHAQRPPPYASVDIVKDVQDDLMEFVYPPGSVCSETETNTDWASIGEDTVDYGISNPPCYFSANEVLGIEYSNFFVRTFELELPGEEGCKTPHLEVRKFAISRNRDVACDPGYEQLQDSNGKAYCSKLQEQSCGIGNPTSPALGNKYHRETDFDGGSGLELTRYYDSHSLRYEPLSATIPPLPRPLGNHWQTNWDRRIHPIDTATVMAQAVRPDGKIKSFDHSGNQTIGFDGIRDRLTRVVNGKGETTSWVLHSSNDEQEVYSAEGYLNQVLRPDGNDLSVTRSDGTTSTDIAPTAGYVIEVSNAAGRSIEFDYTTGGLLESVTFPDGLTVNYTYDSNRMLETVDYGTESRLYHYEEGHSSRSHLLTGITDENDSRYSTYDYDNSSHRVTTTKHAGDVNDYTFTYSGATTTVTDPLDAARDYTFQNVGGVLKNTGVSQSCQSCGSANQTIEYDADGMVFRRVDFNGNETRYYYDNQGRESSRTEAYGTADARTMTTEWDPVFNRRTEVTDPGQTTTYTYNSRGQELTRTVTDTATMETRTWTMTYHETAPLTGLVATIDGPRTDVTDITTYAYYSDTAPDGSHRPRDLHTVTNSLDHVTEYLEYDGAGRPLEIEDANGVVTTLAYHARGWLTSRTVAGATTTFDYYPTGLIQRITRPDGSFVEYEYDDAHRLTAIEDAVGNRIEYMLDDMGNREAETIKDPSGNVRKSLTRTYNTLNRLIHVVNSNGTDTTTFGYDDNGNRTSVTDPLGYETTYDFDALDRLETATDELLGVTTYDYDDRDNLTHVTDAKGLITQYVYNGLDDMTQLISPDTGTTDFVHNDGGLRTQLTDARGKVAGYDYDELGRPVATDYADNALDLTFHYDDHPAFCDATEQNAVGRLNLQTADEVQQRFCFDARGNVSRYRQQMSAIVDLEVDLTHDPADNIETVTYPSGLTITYSRDAAGRITSVAATGAGINETLVTSIDYEPFGPMKSWTFGNGIAASVAYDQDYRVDQINHGTVLQRIYGDDAAGNIDTITDALDANYSQSFDYDELHRLENASGDYGMRAFTYDAIGNRETKIIDGVTTIDITMEEDPKTNAPISHRIADIDGTPMAHDANGNITTDTEGRMFTFGDHNRMATSSANGVSATYLYNANGERVVKTVDGVTTYFLYGLNGELLGEYDQNGVSLREYVWANGQILASVVTSSETSSHVIIDDFEGDYSISNEWGLGDPAQSGTAGYDGDFYVALNDNPINPNPDPPDSKDLVEYSYTWRPHLTGAYDIFAYVSTDDDRDYEAEYRIDDSQQSRVLFLNQHAQQSYLGRFTLANDTEIKLVGDPQTTMLDALRFEPVSANIAFYHNDHLGTPQVLTNEAGTIVWQANYHPFGETDILVNTVENNIRFPGQYFDAETGLHYNYFRDYNPDTGRYVESDPIGLWGGVSTYGYAEQNPAVIMDPYGLDGFNVFDLVQCLADPDARNCHEDFAEKELGDLGDGVLDGIGYASARKNCETYFECTTRCVIDAAIGEAITSGIARKLKAYAQLLARQKAVQFVSGAGTVSTALSGAQAVSCTWRCAEKKDE